MVEFEDINPWIWRADRVYIFKLNEWMLVKDKDKEYYRKSEKSEQQMAIGREQAVCPHHMEDPLGLEGPLK